MGFRWGRLREFEVDVEVKVEVEIEVEINVGRLMFRSRWMIRGEGRLMEDSELWDRRTAAEAASTGVTSVLMYLRSVVVLLALIGKKSNMGEFG